MRKVLNMCLSLDNVKYQIHIIITRKMRINLEEM